MMSTCVTPMRPGPSFARTERRVSRIWVSFLLLTPLVLMAAGCATGYDAYSYGTSSYGYSLPYEYSYPYYYNPYSYSPYGYYYYPYGSQYHYQGGQQGPVPTVPERRDSGAGWQRDRPAGGGGTKDRGGGTRGGDSGRSGGGRGSGRDR
jgi:hypothetical protein